MFENTNKYAPARLTRSSKTTRASPTKAGATETPPSSVYWENAPNFQNELAIN